MCISATWRHPDYGPGYLTTKHGPNFVPAPIRLSIIAIRDRDAHGWLLSINPVDYGYLTDATYTDVSLSHLSVTILPTIKPIYLTTLSRSVPNFI